MKMHNELESLMKKIVEKQEYGITVRLYPFL